MPAMLVGIVLGGWLVAGLSATSLRQAIGGAALLFGSLTLVVVALIGALRLLLS